MESATVECCLRPRSSIKSVSESMLFREFYKNVAWMLSLNSFIADVRSVFALTYLKKKGAVVSDRTNVRVCVFFK